MVCITLRYFNFELVSNDKLYCARRYEGQSGYHERILTRSLLKRRYLTLREVSVFRIFLVHISSILDEYGDLLDKFPHSVQIQENKDQKNYEHGHFLRSVIIH